MKIGRLIINADRFPWQRVTHAPIWAKQPDGKERWGWNPDSQPMARFGGGWKWALGFRFSTGVHAGGKAKGKPYFTLLLDLLIGSVKITNNVPMTREELEEAYPNLYRKEST